MDENKKITVQKTIVEQKRDDRITGAFVKDVKSNKKKVKVQSWVLLLLIDIGILAASIYLISVLPKIASDLNKARSDEQKVIESKKVDITGLEYVPTRESVEKLTSYFPEETGYISFIETLENMKNDGSIKYFSIVGDNALKDKTGAYGLPFIVEFEGSWENINISLQKLQNIPYLVRAINVDVRIIDENVINFKYGGFLYVSDKLAKTR